jgi:ABC-type dipeptide/oligopeptide/nickel transport system permease subunit
LVLLWFLWVAGLLAFPSVFYVMVSAIWFFIGFFFIIVALQVRAVKIYAATVKTLKKKEREG